MNVIVTVLCDLWHHANPNPKFKIWKKTKYLVKKKELVLFSIKELSKVPNIDVSTLYISDTWFVYTYIWPALSYIDKSYYFI